jgi:beta-glucosidase
LLINNVLSSSTAVISAWLPGTSGGQSVFDGIYGDYLFRPEGSKKNTLSVDWPVDMQSLKDFPVYNPEGDIP